MFLSLHSYVVGTGTQDKSAAKRVRVFSPFFLSEGGGGGGTLDDGLWRVSCFILSAFLHFQVDLLRGQKSDKVDVTLQPEELEAMENVLPAKYEFYCFELT